jgi:hypothetical protein
MTTRDPIAAHVCDSPSAKEIDPVGDRFTRVSGFIMSRWALNIRVTT